MSDMRKILENFDKVQKKTLNEAFVVECPPDMPTMKTGGDLSINITGDAASMSQILRALAGIQGGRMSMGTAMQDDPDIPGRDDVEGDQDLNQGIIGTTLGGALGAGLGLATGAGPMATTLGALSGAAAGDSLTDRDEDDPRIPGRDDVEGDQDLQADIGGISSGILGGGIGKEFGPAGAKLGSALGVMMNALDKLKKNQTTIVNKVDALSNALVPPPSNDLTDRDEDDPRIPGRDDVEGDQDLQAGVLGNIGTTAGQTVKHGAVGAGIGAALGGAAGMALGGPAGAIQGAKLGGLGGAALGGAAGRGAATAKMTKKELQAGNKDNPRIPGRDDVEGDTDLQQDIGGLATGALDALKGFGAQAADAVAQGSQAAGDAIATGAKAAGDAAASTGLGQRAIDAMGQASDWAGNQGASIGSKIGGAIGSNFGPQTGPFDGLGRVVGAAKGAELGRAIGKVAPAAAATGAGLAIGSKALGGTGDKKERNRPAENSPSEEYMSAKEMMAGGNDLHHEKHPSDIRLKDPSAFSDIEEGGFKDQEIELQDALYDFAQEIQKGMHTYDNVVDELNGMFDDVKASNDKISMNAFKVLRSLEPEDFGPGEGGGPNRASSVAQDAMDIIDGSDDDDYKPLEGYDNEPDEKYSDHDMMLNKLSGGINGKKKMYKAAQRGDNAMAVEMKARLEAKLAEKKNAKPDFLDMDKDGDKKEPMKKAVADKKAKGPVKETSQELNDMIRFLHRLL